MISAAVRQRKVFVKWKQERGKGMRKRKIIYTLAAVLLIAGCVFGIYGSMKPENTQVSVMKQEKEDLEKPDAREQEDEQQTENSGGASQTAADKPVSGKKQVKKNKLTKKELKKLKKEAASSEVILNCKLPKIEEKIEKVSFEYMEFQNEETRKKLETIVADNPEKKIYNLNIDIPRGWEGYKECTEEDPYEYLCLDYTELGEDIFGNTYEDAESDKSGFALYKEVHDGLKKRWKNLEQSFVEKKMQEGLEILGILAAPPEKWEVEKKKRYWDKIPGIYYEAKVKQEYKGIPIENGESSDKGSLDCTLAYGEYGWYDISVHNVKELRGTKEYITLASDKADMENIRARIERSFKLGTKGYQYFNIEEAGLCYYPQNGELKPAWKLTGQYQMGKGQFAFSRKGSWYIDAVSGEILKGM